MFKLQDFPDSQFIDGMHQYKPVVTLKSEHGGISHIIIDDGCYVLMNKIVGEYRYSPYWFPEAVDAMKSLPTLAIK